MLSLSEIGIAYGMFDGCENTREVACSTFDDACGQSAVTFPRGLAENYQENRSAAFLSVEGRVKGVWHRLPRITLPFRR